MKQLMRDCLLVTFAATIGALLTVWLSQTLADPKVVHAQTSDEGLPPMFRKDAWVIVGKSPLKSKVLAVHGTWVEFTYPPNHTTSYWINTATNDYTYQEAGEK